MSANFYKDGSWNVICQVCHKKRKRESVREMYNGLWACTDKGCWNPKPKYEQPLPVIPDGQPVWPSVPRQVSYLNLVYGHKVTDNIQIVDPTMTVDDIINSSARTGIIYMFGQQIQLG